MICFSMRRSNGIQNPHCDPFAFIDWFARIRFEKTNWQKEDLQLSKKRLLKIPMTSDQCH